MGKHIDNASSGGITVGVDENGFFYETGCQVKPQYKEFKQTDTGVSFKGLRISNFKEVIQTTLRAHSRLPWFGIIGWDITINEKNEVVIIEYNPPCDMRIEQIIFKGSAFGVYHEDIFKQVYNK